VKRKILTSMLVIVVIAFGAVAQAQDAKEEATKKVIPGKADTLKWAESSFHYVGEKKCKMCHKDQFKSWLETPHAKAWEALKPEEQKDPECAGCHSTGMNKDDSLLVNVGCEACHGPGSDYKKKKTMEDVKLAAAAGLLPITEATCVRCHNEKSPTFDGFKYEEALKTGIHAHPAAEEAEEKK
jgi:hypothetical protein